MITTLKRKPLIIAGIVLVLGIGLLVVWQYLKGGVGADSLVVQGPQYTVISGKVTDKNGAAVDKVMISIGNDAAPVISGQYVIVTTQEGDQPVRFTQLQRQDRWLSILSVDQNVPLDLTPDKYHSITLTKGSMVRNYKLDY